MKKMTYIIVLLLSYNLGYGQSIFDNPIIGSDPEDNNPYITGQNVDPNITVSGISRGAGNNPANGLNRYNANSWNTPFDVTAYFEFTLTPNATFEIDLINFVYSGQASGTGPINFAFRSDLDGFTANVGTPDAAGVTIDLSGAAYQNISSSITFRLYAWGASGGGGTFSINNFTFNGVVSSPTCSGITTWNGNVLGWDNGSPDLTTNAVLNASYNTATSGGSFSACSLVVNSSGTLPEYTLTVANGDHIEIQNNIIANGNIVVQSQGAVLQIDNNATTTNNGIITVAKETAPANAWYEYTYWSSPVSGETVGQGLLESGVNRRFIFNGQNFLDATAETLNNGATLNGQDDIDDNGDDWVWVDGTTPMTSGVGYAATHDISLFNSTPGFPKQIIYNFEGAFNNGIYEVPIYRNDSEPNDYNWNFIGNPYPSAIDADLFLAANSNIATDVASTKSIDGAIFLWSQATPPSATANGNEPLNFSNDDYAIINAVGESAGGDMVKPSRIIPSGQGFFVSMSNTAPATVVSGSVLIADNNVVFNNSMRVKGATDNSQFFKNSNLKEKSNTVLADKLWLNLTSDNGVFNQILVGYISGATNDDDGISFDAIKYPTKGSALYTTIEGSNNKFAIQGKAPSDLNENEIINLGFKTAINVATLYTISIDELQGDFLNTNTVYLKDNLLNVTHDLSTSDYTFTSEVGEFNNRFQIGFSTQVLSNEVFDLDKNTLSILELEHDNIQFLITPL